MRIYLVRHGETEWNKEGVFRGRKDVPLNERGRNQAEKTGAYFLGKNVQSVFSSPLSRASQTAEAITRAVGLPPATILEGFIDMDFGKWEGLSVDEARDLSPKEYGIGQRSPLRFAIEGSETLAGVRRRAKKALLKATSMADDDVVIVTHRVICKIIILWLLGAPNNLFWAIKCDPCSISVTENGNGRNVLECINDTCHLRPGDHKKGYTDF